MPEAISPYDHHIITTQSPSITENILDPNISPTPRSVRLHSAAEQLKPHLGLARCASFGVDIDEPLVLQMVAEVPEVIFAGYWPVIQQLLLAFVRCL